jgi:hypothetical protein
MIFDATTKDRIGLSLPGIDAFLLVLRCAPLRSAASVRCPIRNSKPPQAMECTQPNNKTDWMMYRDLRDAVTKRKKIVTE